MPWKRKRGLEYEVRFSDVSAEYPKETLVSFPLFLIASAAKVTGTEGDPDISMDVNFELVAIHPAQIEVTEGGRTNFAIPVL